MARRQKGTSALVTSTLVLSTLLFSAPSALAAPMEIDAPGWQVVVPTPPGSAGIGSALAAGDITGDGRDDLSVLFTPDYSFRFDPPFVFSNSSWDIFAGGPSGVASSSLSRSSAALSGFAGAAGVTFPRPAPDFNGDGLADFAIATTNYLTVNGAYEAAAELFYGSASGLPSAPSCRVAVSADVNQSVSYTWMPGGDFDGDGASDLLLLVTAYPNVPPQGGNASGPYDPEVYLQMVHGGAGCTPRFEPGVGFPHSAGGYAQLVGWGDFNGDGKDDAVLDETVYSPSSNGEHHMHVLPGSATGPSNATVTALTITSSYSTRIAPGIDMDGDGYGDLALLLGYQAGFFGEYYSLLVYPGGPAGLSASPGTPQNLPGEGFASALPSFGDLDGDGALDLVLVHTNSSSNESIVKLDLYFGAGGIFRTTRDWNATVVVRDENYTWYYGNLASLDASGDFDGDGRDDLVLLVGSSSSFPGPLAGVTVSASAAVLLYYGVQILKDVSGIEPIGFDAGVAYPTFEYGFNVLQRASNRTYFDGFRIQTEVGALTYDPALDTFSFAPNASLPQGEYLQVKANSTAVWDEATHTWDIRFRFEFNWTFPREESQTFRLVTSHAGAPLATGRGVAGVFRLEKDFAFVGTLAVRDTSRGLDLSPGAWVQASAPLQVSGITVSFEGAPSRLVPAAFYNWSATDNDFTIWNAPGGPLYLLAEADSTSDRGDNVTLGLTGLPDPGVGAPTAAFAFGVDADAPNFTDAQPSNDSWIAQKVVTLGIVAVDPLSGIDITTLEYQTATAGPGAFGPWVSPSFDASDPNAVRARADAAFENGEANYFHYRVRDLVGNGYTESPAFQVRVDTLHVVFSAPSPAPEVWQRSTAVPVGITVTDLGASGVLASSVAFRTSTDDIFAYGPWTPVGGLANAVEIPVLADALLAQGDVNYVQWRGEDIVGTGLTLSGHFQVRVDASPVAFGNFTPDPSLRRTRANVSVEIRLAEGGPAKAAKSGVNASSVAYRFAPGGGDWGNWTSEGLTLANLDGTNWSARVELRLAPGPANRVQFKGLDLAGNGPTESAVFSLHLNRAPTANISLNLTNATIYLNDSVSMTALLADPDGDAFSFAWQDGAGDTLSRNSTTLNLTLPLGAHAFRLTVRDAFGATSEAQVTLTVIERPAPPPPPPTPPPVQVTSDSFSMATFLLALLGAAAVAVLLAASRRRRQRPE